MTADLITTASRHDWVNAEKREIATHESSDGCHRIEKTCPKCKMRRITILPAQGFPWHEWMTAEGKVWRGEATPPCIARGSG